MYTLELQTSLELMKSRNKTETSIFLSVMRSLFLKAFFFTFIIQQQYILSFFVRNPRFPKFVIG